jgi:cyclophilin family peptidyl-prolyl cis-trans isomerase
MIQGGGFEPGLKEKPTRDPIKNESNNGLHNVRGTIAMARTNVPDSATAEFFINVVDNSGKLDRATAGDGVGYCVFGKVLDGMDVADKVRDVKTGSREGVIQGMPEKMGDVPVEDVVIKSVRRREK